VPLACAIGAAVGAALHAAAGGSSAPALAGLSGVVGFLAMSGVITLSGRKAQQADGEPKRRVWWFTPLLVAAIALLPASSSLGPTGEACVLALLAGVLFSFVFWIAVRLRRSSTAPLSDPG
jgi:hypothetical protein